MHLLSSRTDVHTSKVEKVAVWGNISDTIYPDISNATLDGVNAMDFLDTEWYHTEYIKRI